MKYLRFRQEAGKWNGTLFSCFYKPLKSDISARPLALTASLLHSFTGDVFTQNLDTGERLHSAYQNGVWQNPAKSKTQRKTSSCTTYYTCHWNVHCPADAGGDQADYYSSSTGGCDEPTGFTLSCGYRTEYTLIEQIEGITVCDDPNDPDPNEPLPPAPVPAVSDPIIDGDAYVIRPHHNLSQILAISTYNGGNRNGVPIFQKTANYYDPGQVWIITSAGNGYWYLKSNTTDYRSRYDLYLDIGGFATAPGAKAVGWEFQGAINQQWQLTLQSNGMYTMTARHSGHVLEIGGASTAPYAQANQWIYYGHASQQWLIYHYTRLP